MNKTMKKIFSLVMTILVVVSAFATVMATTGADIPDIGGTPNITGLQTFGSSVLGLIQWLAYIIAIAMLIYVGVKYTMASANEKADLKNAMVKYVVGAILIAGAATVVRWIAQFAGTAQA